MHSEGILAGEMKHGPLALVDDTMPILGEPPAHPPTPPPPPHPPPPIPHPPLLRLPVCYT